MAGPIPPDDGEEILRMQRGVRDWVLRSSRQGEQGFRRVSPPVLLSLLCAAAFSPLLAVGAGITGAAAVAGIGVLSSVGSGVLTGVIAEALDRLRPHGEGRAASREDLETEIARQIQQVFAAGEAHSAELRAEIAAVLKEINAGGTALQEAFETGNERVRSAVVSVEFSHDGTLLATASWDGTARLWDVATQRQIGPPMSIGLNLMDGVAFSPDGKILATAGADGAARLWDIAFPRDLPRAVCAIAGRSLTRAEWNTYAPTESFQRTCP
jgi:WD40 repeat protein